MNTTTTYKFAELSKDAKERAIEGHREFMTSDHPWWEGVYDAWTAKLVEELGYDDIDIQFSGFWSQGDGASFTAKTVPNHDTDEAVQAAWLQLKAAADLLGVGLDKWEDLPQLAWGSVYRTDSHYSHEYTVSVEWEDYSMSGDEDDDLTPQWRALSESIRDYYEGLTETVRSLCREIYDDLEKEYEWLTADEQVINSIEANDYNFDEEGELVW